MEKQVQESLRVLSERIAKTSMEKTLAAGIAALNSIANPDLNVDGEDLLAELTKSIHESISAEFGRLIAFIEAANHDPKVVESVMQEIRAGVYHIPVSAIGLSVNAVQSLSELGCNTIGELLRAHPVDVCDANGVGAVNQQRISDFLYSKGITWPGLLTSDQIRERRYARLDELPLSRLVRAQCIKRDTWQINCVPSKELRAYMINRLCNTPDAELYPFELNAFFKMFGKAVLWELNASGIVTFGDLLPLTKDELIQLAVGRKYVVPEMLVDRVNEGLAIIGRAIK